MLLSTCFRDLFRAKAGDTSEGNSGDDKPKSEPTALDRIAQLGKESRATSPEKQDDEPESKDSDETAPEAEEQEPLDEAAAEDEEESFSDEVLERAMDLGLTAREVRRFETQRELERELDRIERLEQRVLAKEKEAKKREKTGSDETSVKAEALDKKLGELLASGIDGETVTVLKELKELAAAGHEEAKQAKRMLAELQEAGEQMKERVEQAEIARIIENKERQFDSVIEALDEDYPGEFGKGRGERLDQRSKEYKNRAAVWKRYVAIERSYIEDGQRPPPPQQLIREAAAAVFAGRTTQVARNRLKEDLKKAGSQTLVRSRSNHKELTGEALVRAKDREFWEKNRD